MTSALPVTFGEFGEALVREVFTPEFLLTRLDAVLDSIPRVPEFPGHVSSLRSGTPRLVEDDGFERRFVVTVHGLLTVDIGPKTLGAGVDASMETDLTVRVRTYRPTIVRIDIDPVTPDDIRVQVQGRSEWLPGSWLDAGGAGLGKSAKRWLPMVAVAVNGAVEASASRRQVDVLAGRARQGAPAQGTSDRRAADRRAAGVTAVGRIGFAEFGESLIRRAVDRDTVTREINSELDPDSRVEFDGPKLVRGVVQARLVEVTAMPSAADELSFMLALDIVVELHIGPGANATVVASTLRAPVPLRVSATIEPATLHLRFEPVPVEELLVVAPLRRIGGRRIPIPRAKLTELIPPQVAAELNQRLARADRRIVLSELA
jgi:hypothetical protein